MNQTKYQGSTREWTVSPVDFEDFGKLKTQLRYRDYYQLKDDGKNDPELAKQPEYADMLREQFRECSKNNPTLDECFSSITEGDPRTIIYFIYLSLVKHHKEIQPETLGDQLTMEDVSGLVEMVNYLSMPVVDAALAKHDEKKRLTQSMMATSTEG